MQLGVMATINELGTDPPAIRDYVQALEGIGIDFVATPEHVVGAHPDRLGGQAVHSYDKPYYEPFPFLGFCAGATRRLGLATAILILPQRQTAVVAKQAAMLDILCAGRLRLGVGVGRNFIEYEVLGEEFRTRGARIEEQVEVLRRLWTESLVTYTGRWHQLDRVGINPPPVQQPIPIWMGSYVGGTSPRVLERIGRIADGWLPQMPPGEELEADLATIHAHARDAGRSPADIGIECVMNVSATDDPAGWAATAAAFRHLGATHLKVIARAPGPEAHLAIVSRWHEAVCRA